MRPDHLPTREKLLHQIIPLPECTRQDTSARNSSTPLNTSTLLQQPLLYQLSAVLRSGLRRCASPAPAHLLVEGPVGLLAGCAAVAGQQARSRTATAAVHLGKVAPTAGTHLGTGGQQLRYNNPWTL